MKMMEIFQEPTFTVFLSLALFYLVTKIFSFAVYSSNSYRGTVDSSIYEGGVAEDTGLGKGLRVRKAEGTRKLKFIGDDLINRAHFYEGSEYIDDVKHDRNISTMQFIEESSEIVAEFGDNRFNTSATEPAEESGQMVYEFRDFGSSNEELIGLITRKQCSDLEKDYDYDLNEVVDDDDKTNVVFRVEEKKKDEICMEDIKQDEYDASNQLLRQLHGGEGIDVERNQTSESENDDWEGIERSELEKVFAGAVNYVEFRLKGKSKNDEKLDNDVLMELYGLHKVALEGPCHEPQPLAFKVSSRAKWNSWHKLGMISRETAMEQYLRVLSERIPRWSHDYLHADDDVKDVPDSETQHHEDKRKSKTNENLCTNTQDSQNEPI